MLYKERWAEQTHEEAQTQALSFAQGSGTGRPRILARVRARTDTDRATVCVCVCVCMCVCALAEAGQGRQLGGHRLVASGDGGVVFKRDHLGASVWQGQFARARLFSSQGARQS
jgi:hypothetical protein